MSTDSLDSLPMNDKHQPRAGDLEFVYNIFQPKNAPVIKRGIGSIKMALVGAAIFAVLTLPFITSLSDSYWKNTIYSRMFLVVLFMIIFFMVQKLVLKV